MGVRLPDKLEPSENDLTAENLVPREMGPRRAVFLLMASLLLWCGQYAARPRPCHQRQR